MSLTAQINNDHSNAQHLIYNYQYSEHFPTQPKVAIGIEWSDVGLNEIQAKESPYLEL